MRGRDIYFQHYNETKKVLASGRGRILLDRDV